MREVEASLTLSEVKGAQSCPILCDPVGYTVHGILIKHMQKNRGPLPTMYTQQCVVGILLPLFSVTRPPLHSFEVASRCHIICAAFCVITQQ